MPGFESRAPNRHQPQEDSVEPKINSDGTVTYWSVYQQTWVWRAYSIPDRELAAMDSTERELVLRSLATINDD
jgi:hypothetical protein